MFEDLNKEAAQKGNITYNTELVKKLGDWKDLFVGLVDVLKDLVFILDKEGRIVLINQYGASQLDYTPSELLYKHFTEIIDPVNLSQVNTSVTLALKNEFAFFETQLIDKFEKPNKFQVNIKSIKDGNDVIGLMGVAKNVTLQRKFEDELSKLKPKLIEADRLISLERSRAANQKIMLEELNKMKSEFVSNISHELRTPLASIVGFSETIASDPNMPSEMRLEFNNIILNEGKRLAKLINDVLDLSRMETGRIALNRTKTNIVKLLKKLIDNTRHKLEEKKQILTYEIPFDEIIIEADEERLYQVFESILDNSIKFTDIHGRIRVILNNLYREVEITISDTGMGIPEKDIPYLFQKFYKVNRPNTDIPGAGMGLVFVKQIVDLHRGLINIQSEPDKGTTVLIKLLKNIRD